jgi:hypothetical protein
MELLLSNCESSALREAGVARHIVSEIGRRTRLLGIVYVAGVVWLGSGAAAYSGPCTTQIAALEQEINSTPPGPETGPSAPQTIGAQLHHQPTPGSVEHGEYVANKDGDIALERARKADSRGDAKGCSDALNEARHLYGMD